VPRRLDVGHVRRTISSLDCYLGTCGRTIDTDAGDGPVKHMAREYPTAFYEGLISTGGGLMQGKIMLQCWKGVHPTQHYIQEHIDLYEHIDDPIYLQKEETFESWYENPIDLPGRFYLQTIVRLFKENRLAKGTFVGLGRRRELKNITCPVYLLADDSDDITTTEQVLDAEKYLGTPKNMIEKAVIPGGRVDLFMGSRTLRNAWPAVARWIANH
jgi:poly(3-hydroxybutyrate) depolymerase